MAPEVVKQTQYTRKADIWSLGCMMVEMFTNDHPFPEFSQMQAIFQVSWKCHFIWYHAAKSIFSSPCLLQQIGSYIAPTIPDHIDDDAKDFLKRTFDL